MILLLDDLFIDATVTTGGLVSDDEIPKLKTSQLADAAQSILNDVDIEVDLGSDKEFDIVALCGTSILPTATIKIIYDTVPITGGSPFQNITDFSNLNQVLISDIVIIARYIKIEIRNGALFQIGNVRIGKKTGVQRVSDLTPVMSYNSSSTITSSGQVYGRRNYNYFESSFTVLPLTYDDTETVITQLQRVQNVEPIVLIEFEDNITDKLYRPKYGIITDTSTQITSESHPSLYSLTLNFRETF